MFRTWLKRIFKRRPKGPAKQIPWPTTEEIVLLPWFDGLRMEDIVVVASKESAQKAYEEILPMKVVGFDTESKPTFIKGQKSTGPHVVQFSTLNRAYIFMLNEPECRRVAGLLIELKTLQKVGFGLNDDLKRIPIKLRVKPHSVLDVETVFAAKGYGRGVGVKVGVAIAFKRRFRKSRSASTSNWGAAALSEKQLLYAANDAYAAVKVYHALK